MEPLLKPKSCIMQHTQAAAVPEQLCWIQKTVSKQSTSASRAWNGKIPGAGTKTVTSQNSVKQQKSPTPNQQFITLRNAFYIYYDCLSNHSHKKIRDNRINSSLLKKKVLIDYCSWFSIHKQINEKLTACESWKIAGTQPCLTADLDLLSQCCSPHKSQMQNSSHS